MKRVLFVDHADRVLGGAEINLIELIEEAQRSSDWEIICACREHSPLAQRLRKIGARTIDYGFGEALNKLRFVGKKFPWNGVCKGWIDLRRASARLATIIAQSKPDVVISCTLKDHIAAARARRRWWAPGVWWMNDLVTDDFFPRPARFAIKLHTGEIDKIVAVSECVRQPFGSAARVIHNGISLQRYRGVARGFLRSRLGTPPDQPLFGVVGRLCPWKGQRIFLELADAWAQAGAPGHFVLIGQASGEDQAYEADLRHFVAESSVQGRVHFAGAQENIAATLSDLDALLHTSLKPEPFGRVLIEAMAVGAPVIAADAGGPREIVVDGVNGYLARPGDPFDYLEKLRRLWPKSDSSDKIAAAARHTVEERFTIQRVLREFEEVISELL